MRLFIGLCLVFNLIFLMQTNAQMHHKFKTKLMTVVDTNLWEISSSGRNVLVSLKDSIDIVDYLPTGLEEYGDIKKEERIKYSILFTVLSFYQYEANSDETFFDFNTRYGVYSPTYFQWGLYTIRVFDTFLMRLFLKDIYTDALKIQQICILKYNMLNIFKMKNIYPFFCHSCQKVKMPKKIIKKCQKCVRDAEQKEKKHRNFDS